MVLAIVEAVAALIGAVTPFVIAWVVLSNWQSVKQGFADIGNEFGKDWIAPAITPVINAALVFFVATTGIVFAIYFLEKGIARRTGDEVYLPAVPAIQPPPPPSFGASSSYGVNAGPVSVGVGQQFGPGAPRPARPPASRASRRSFGIRRPPTVTQAAAGIDRAQRRQAQAAAQQAKPRASFRANPRRHPEQAA